MQNNLPVEAKDALSDITDDSLDFIEREVFLAFDESYRQFKQDDIDTRASTACYEDAMETLQAIRTLKQAMNEEEFEQAKQIQEYLDN